MPTIGLQPRKFFVYDSVPQSLLLKKTLYNGPSYPSLHSLPQSLPFLRFCTTEALVIGLGVHWSRVRTALDRLSDTLVRSLTRVPPRSSGVKIGRQNEE